MNDANAAVERRLDSLLRGEISAAETYKQVLERIEDAERAARLRAMQEEHGDAIRFLYAQIAARGIEPSSHSGPWGAFARTIEGAAAMLGDAPALKVLREGEERGLASYEEALEEAILPPECRQQVETRFVPRQRRHIDELTRMIDAS